jgi:hypothetical protein
LIIGSGDLGIEARAPRELRQPLGRRGATVARFGQHLDVLGDGGIHIAFAFVDRAHSISVNRRVAGLLAQLVEDAQRVVELVVIPEDGGDFEVGVALARLKRRQLVPLCAGALEVAERGVGFAGLDTILMIGRIDVGQVRKRQRSLFVKLVGLLAV